MYVEDWGEIVFYSILQYSQPHETIPFKIIDNRNFKNHDLKYLKLGLTENDWPLSEKALSKAVRCQRQCSVRVECCSGQRSVLNVWELFIF